jgi:L-alanine-DL-glutamate epimerase-like enolase superfamily enzyme
MGITGAMKVAHAAEGFGLDVELHGGGPAQRHCMASIRNTNYYELGLVHPNAPASGAPCSDYPDTLDAIDANGHVPVPDGPGLGITLDWDFIEAHRTGLKSYE